MSGKIADIELATYAGACLQLELEALDRGIVLQDVQANLCEDGLTVLLMAPDHGRWIIASFTLSKKLDDKTFDANRYVEGFNKQRPLE